MRLDNTPCSAARFLPGRRTPPACSGVCAAVVLALIAGQACGQDQFDHFTTDNGLPQNTVAAITQTPDRYLWLATYDGLVRYDGVRFTIFNRGSTPAIPCNWFQTLWTDDQGTLWAGTVEGGLLRFRDGVFRGFTMKDGLPERGVRSIHGPGSGAPLLCFGKGKVCFWDDNRCSAAPADPRALREFVDEFRTRWVLEEDALLRSKDDTLTSFPVRLTVEDFLERRFVDRSGGLWVGTRADGVYHIRGDKLRHYTQADGLPAGTLIRIGGEDGAGNLWVFSERELFRLRDRRFTRLSARDGLTTTHIRAVFCDREGTVWVGSNDQGLFRLSRRFLTTCAKDDGLLDRTVYPILEDRASNIWLGSGSGVTQFAKGRFTPRPLVRSAPEGPDAVAFVSTDDPRRRTDVRCLFEDRAGRLWMGNTNGLFVLEKGTLADRSALVDRFSVQACLEDRAGDFWLGTDRGLFQTRGETRVLYTLKEGLPDLRVTILHEDQRGDLWVGTRAGLARKQGNRFVAVGADEALAAARVRCLHEEAGVLWIGTFDSGLWRLEDGRLTQFTTRSGLHSNGVFQILDDRRGNFWFSCNRGLYRVRRQQLDDFADGKASVVNCVPYGREEGMLSTECNGERPPAGIRARDGKLWFPTMHGVVVLDPDADPHNTLPPLVTIESAVVDRSPIRLAEGIRLRPGQTDLELQYTAPSFLKAEHMHFKYRLVGMNEDWVDAEPRRSVHYSHLPPGRYTFKVMAANSDGVWNDAGAELAIEVMPYFYQTRWFTALGVVGLMALVAVACAVRMRGLKANARRLTEQVAERTRELETANGRLEKLAALDGLTNIANHRRFKEFLAQEWRRSQRTGSPLAVLMLDVDYFKRFNDSHGHQGGDDCLRRVAGVLAETVNRATDLAARYGGEEFAVLLGDTGLDGARVMAEAIRTRVEALGMAHGDSPAGPCVTLRVGFAAVVPDRDASPEDLIADADQALYRAKELGRNRCEEARETETLGSLLSGPLRPESPQIDGAVHAS